MVIEVKLEKFEGPLELLVELIERQRLDITEVSLAKITDQFLDYLNNLKEVDLRVLADFLVVASRLILIKSRVLLPVFEVTEEEEFEIEELKQRLLIYQKMREGAKDLKMLFLQRKVSFEREFSLGAVNFYPPKNINPQILKHSFNKLIERLPKLEKTKKAVLEEIITLEEKINEIKLRLRRGLARFSELTKNAKSKIEIVIAFLAVLELVKQKTLSAAQKGHFDDIVLKPY